MSLACAASSLPIDVVSLGRGALGVVPCPGLGRSPDADLESIADFRPDAIVTLLSAQELKLAPRLDLAEALPRLTSQWHHCPLRAGAAPGARFERQWAYVGWRVRQILRRGGRVLLHCDESGGRARWLAARILRELGMGAAEVAARVRVQRASLAPVMPKARAAPPAPDGLAGRMLGCLLGGAVGDAFGYPIEFKSLAQIRKRFGPAGLGEPLAHNDVLTASDDTQMTLYTAEGLLAALAAQRTSDRALVDEIRAAYLAWFRTQVEEWQAGAAGLSQHRALWAVRAPGSTCLSALKAGGRGTPQAPPNVSKGSGAVMRVAPLGLIMAIGPDDAFRLGDAVAALTHGHVAARLSAAAFASLLRDLLAETPLNLALDRVEARLHTAPGGGETLAAVRAARALAADGGTPTESAIAKLGEGWCGDEALAIGLYAALRADSFAEALRIAANHDGDSDTTAALAGQLWGALHGLEAVAHDWIRRLDLFEPLCDIASRLITAPGQAAPARAEPPRLREA